MEGWEFRLLLVSKVEEKIVDREINGEWIIQTVQQFWERSYGKINEVEISDFKWLVIQQCWGQKFT